MIKLSVKRTIFLSYFSTQYIISLAILLLIDSYYESYFENTQNVEHSDKQFWIINQFGFKVLRWIGNDYSDYNGPIISKDFYYKKNDFLNDFNLIKKKLDLNLT